ncbi:MAG: hypothetical protein A3H28_15185 [Acidobacteria bacterium RIFCSPLOWO2_02_FULL_61_28]|nr:MAG: hypothetical protein A3H28_15185 [Acidobacteria bacterium RIFCSPLOWO2_02_FULL_61_28]
MMYSRNRFGWLLLAIVLSVAPMPAQVVTGAITGRVTDNTGAVIPGATVQVQNVETGLARNTTSDAAGRYEVRNLPPGSYTVTVQQTGFRTEVRSGITLSVGSEVAMNVELSVGSVQERVEVTGEAPAIETTTAALSSLVTPTQMRDLPLNGRSVDQLALLSPGVVNQTQGGRGAFSGNGMRLVIHGGRTGHVLYLLDGLTTADYGGHGPGGASGSSLGVEAIREFRLLTSSFSAEYGRNAMGGVFSAVTRSGTNEFHGSAYEFVRNNIFDARNFFNQVPQRGKDRAELLPFRRNQFGASLGGRLVRDKIFFFVNYEGFRQRQGVPQVATLLDDNARQGLLPDANGVLQPVGPGPNNGLHPAVIPYINLFPRPNQPSIGGGLARYIRDASTATTEDYSMQRMDFNLSEKDSFYWRYIYNPSESTIPSEFEPFFTGSRVVYHYSSVSHTRILSPTALNEFRFGFSRTAPAVTAGPLNLQGGALDFLPGQGFGRLQFTGTAVVGAQVTSLTPLGNPGNNPKILITNRFEVGDTFGLVRGPHSLRFGFSLERPQNNIAWNVFSNQRGVYAFPGLARFLLGSPSQLAFPEVGGDSSPQRGWRQVVFGWFVQDDWRLRPNLTLNVGLRHEFVTDAIEVNGRNAYLPDPRATESVIGPAYMTDKNNFAPRLGLAWDPTGSGKTSIRAGSGLFYNLPIISQVWELMTWDYRFATNYVVGSPTSPVPNFPNALRSGFNPGTRITRTFEPGTHTPTSIHWNLEIARELTPTIAVQVGYVGRHNYHMEQAPHANRAVGAWLGGATLLPDGRKFFAPGLPLMNPNFGDFYWLSTQAWSNYNGFQLGLQKRLSHGLQLQAGYTWSKNLSSVDQHIGGEVSGNPVGPMELDDLRRDYSLSNFHQTHVFNINGKYRMPWDRYLTSGVARAILGGWELNSIWRATSGLPQTIPAGFNVSRNRDPVASDRPDLTSGFSSSPAEGVTAGCPGVPAGQTLGTPDLYFDPCAFSLPLAGTYGNLARNTLIGPGVFNVDLGLVKNTALPGREGMNLEFRAEFFNLFNRANFMQPNTALFTPTGSRRSTAGLITATSTENRQIQFGMKLTF